MLTEVIAIVVLVVVVSVDRGHRIVVAVVVVSVDRGHRNCGGGGGGLC